MRPPRSLLVPAVALAMTATLGLTACGGGSSTQTQATQTVTNPVASAPGAKAPPTDATRPGTTPATTPKGTKTTRAAPTIPVVKKPKSPSEEPVRVPATYTIRHGKMRPAGVVVPPFVAIVVTVVSGDGKPHQLAFEVPPGIRKFTIAAQGRLEIRLPGLHAGRYGILLDGKLGGGILAGGDIGP